MSLYALPPELKLNIIAFLPPESSFNFALTCRKHSELCQSILTQHGQLFSEWQIIDASDTDTSLWSVLKEVLQDSRRGWYVRELKLPANRPYDWKHLHSHHRPSTIPAVLPEEDQAIFKRAARKLEHLYPVLEGECEEADQHRFANSNDLIATMEASITSGADDAIIVILIHHFPYLKTIMFIGTEGVDCLELTMRRIAHAYKDPTRAPQLPLQHLTTAVIAHFGSNEPDCISVDWACYFLCVPSLRTFAADSIGGEVSFGGREDYLLANAAPCSNVTELYFTRSRVDMNGLEAILAGTKQLKKLTCHYDYVERKVKGSITAIAKHCSHSLEEFIFVVDEWENDNSEPDTDDISLRSFHKLRILNCNWDIVHRQEELESNVDEPLEYGFHNKNGEPADADIRTILPESLEELYLRICYEDDDWETTARLFNFPSASTPNLSFDKVCIQKKGGMYDWDMDTVFGDGPEPLSMFESFLSEQLRSLTDF